MRRTIHETDRILPEAGKVVRHSVLVQIQHWLVAISGLALLFSGFGQLPVYKRYMLDKIPGFSWSTDFILNFRIHMLAAVVFTLAAVFHLVYHYIEGGRSILPRKGDARESFQIISAMIRGKEEPPSGKFLAEQRLAYAFIGISVLLLIITGMFKMLDNLPTVRMPYWLTFWNTMVHNLATLLFLFGFIAHIGAFVIKSNWPLVSSMFNGKVDLGYAKHRHPLWIDGIRGRIASRNSMTAASVINLFAGTMVGTGLVLGAFVHPLWHLLPAFVSVNLIQYSFTGWCPLEILLKRLGYK